MKNCFVERFFTFVNASRHFCGTKQTTRLHASHRAWLNPAIPFSQCTARRYRNGLKKWLRLYYTYFFFSPFRRSEGHVGHGIMHNHFILLFHTHSAWPSVEHISLHVIRFWSSTRFSRPSCLNPWAVIRLSNRGSRVCGGRRDTQRREESGRDEKKEKGLSWLVRARLPRAAY